MAQVDNSGLSRATHKRLKQYSRKEMEMYLQLVYQNGLRDALGYFLQGLEPMLSLVPDMTDELKTKIMETVTKELSGKEKAE